MLNTSLLERNQEVALLRAVKNEQDSKITQLNEELSSLQREITTKAKTYRELESRCAQAQQEGDKLRTKTQELQKSNTELKLKLDVQKSQLEGYKSEIKHYGLELKQQREQLDTYETKYN